MFLHESSWINTEMQASILVNVLTGRIDEKIDVVRQKCAELISAEAPELSLDGFIKKASGSFDNIIPLNEILVKGLEKTIDPDIPSNLENFRMEDVLIVHRRAGFNSYAIASILSAIVCGRAYAEADRIQEAVSEWARQGVLGRSDIKYLIEKAKSSNDSLRELISVVSLALKKQKEEPKELDFDDEAMMLFQKEEPEEFDFEDKSMMFIHPLADAEEVEGVVRGNNWLLASIMVSALCDRAEGGNGEMRLKCSEVVKKVNPDLDLDTLIMKGKESEAGLMDFANILVQGIDETFSLG